jgi:ubiquinone/menaquinone biosynthesis C-methylase UbiE
MDYRLSHLKDGKGQAYDKSFKDKSYRRYIWFWEKTILKKILQEYFPDKFPIKYLDFACGTGRIIGYLEDTVSLSVGVDVSESMLSVARNNVKKSSIINADLTRVNILLGRKFNLVTAFRFFLNAQPELRNSAFRAIYDILADSGYLVFNIHMNEGCVLQRIYSLYYRIMRNRKIFHFMSYRDIEELVQRNGFKIVSTFHFGILPIYNEDSKIPIWLIDKIETFASRLNAMRTYSRYVIYICRKNL